MTNEIVFAGANNHYRSRIWGFINTPSIQQGWWNGCHYYVFWGCYQGVIHFKLTPANRSFNTNTYKKKKIYKIPLDTVEQDRILNQFSQHILVKKLLGEYYV